MSHSETRKERRLQRLGSPAPVCALCGLDVLEALTPVKQSRLDSPTWRRIMERHHLLGRGFPDLVVPLCLNCHALVTELERVTGATARTPDETDTHRTLWRALVWMALLYTSWVRVSREVFRVLDRALRSPEEENSIPGRLLAPVRELLHFLQAQEPETTNRIELYVSRCLSALADEDPEKLAVLQKLSSSLRVPVKGQCY